jgi:hypothetical protein
MKKAGTLLAFLFAGFLPLAAQSNQLLDQILDQPELSFGQAAYLVLTATQKLPDEAGPEQAAEALADSGWKVKVRPADTPITLGEYSYLLMQAFALKGGLFYRLFPRPRYAARELAYRAWITGKAYPGRTLSGEEAVRMLGKVMEAREGGRS